MLMRVLLGTAVYVLIVLLATPFPAVAGLMLTFPVLNGLAIFRSKTSIAASMLLMPVLNGGLCAGCIIAFLLFAQRMSTSLLAWLLMAIISVAWVLIVFSESMRKGIALERQRRYAVLVTVVGALLAAGTLLITEPLVGTQGHAPNWHEFASWSGLGQTIAHSRVKIILFALGYSTFLAFTQVLPLSAGVSGILAGLPLVPFAALFSVAGDDSIDVAIRAAIFTQMSVSVWLAPPIAIWFIYGFSRYRTSASGLIVKRRLLALVTGWMLCGIAIIVLSSLLRIVSGALG